MAMEKQRLGSILLLLLLAFQSRICTGEIRSIILSSDPRPVIVLESFGFSGGHGFAEVSASDLSLHSTKHGTSPPDLSRMGFFLSTESHLVQILLDSERIKNYCVFTSSAQIKVLFTLAQISTSHNSTVYKVPDTNEYGLFFANCYPHVRVSIKLKTAMYNLGQSGVRNYLPLGQTELPAVYSLYAVSYLVLVVVWSYILSKQRLNVHKIHILMLVVVVFKVLTLAAQAVDLEFTRRTGAPHGWNVIFYLLNFLRGVMVFTVIILIGTGWSILKPFLQEKEKKVLMVVVPLQVIANLASIVIDEAGPSTRDWIMWKQVLLLVDIVCCCVVLLPIVWSIKQLREASRSDGKAMKTLAKLTLFRQFYIFVVSYIYFTRIVVFALSAATDFRYRWVVALARELATLAFYLFTGYKFRPAEHNPYISLDDEEDEVAQEALKDDEDFEL